MEAAREELVNALLKLPKPDPAKLEVGAPGLVLFLGEQPVFYFVRVYGRSPNDRVYLSGAAANCVYCRRDDAESIADDAEWDAACAAGEDDEPFLCVVDEVDLDAFPAWATHVCDDWLRKHPLPRGDFAARRYLASQAVISGIEQERLPDDRTR